MLEKSIELPVADSFKNEIGYGRARLSSNAMKRLGVHRGDLVSITGEETTAARVWHSHAHDGDRDIVRIDQVSRQNAKTHLNHHVKLQKIDPKPCTKVILKPVLDEHPKVTFAHGIEKTIYRNIPNRPIIEGQNIFISGFNYNVLSARILFKVVQCWPKGIVRITSDTKIFVRDTLIRNPQL